MPPKVAGGLLLMLVAGIASIRSTVRALPPPRHINQVLILTIFIVWDIAFCIFGTLILLAEDFSPQALLLVAGIWVFNTLVAAFIRHAS